MSFLRFFGEATMIHRPYDQVDANVRHEIEGLYHLDAPDFRRAVSALFDGLLAKLELDRYLINMLEKRIRQLEGDFYEEDRRDDI